MTKGLCYKVNFTESGILKPLRKYRIRLEDSGNS